MIKMEEVLRIDRIYPYPAKYTVDMLNYYIDKYSLKNDVILDPFVGCGTTLLAARFMGRKSYGFDINPIAYQISKVKSNSYDSSDRKKLKNFIMKVESFFKNISFDSITFEVINYDSIEYWFRKEVIYGLSAIKHCINEYHKEEKMKNLYYMVFSYIVLPLSNQESDTRYSSVDKGEITLNEIFKIYIDRLISTFEVLLITNKFTSSSEIYLKDANLINKTLHKDSVDLLITSPPYPNTYDYYLYHKHRMIWLGYDYKVVMGNEIGSRREFSSLKKEADKFTKDLFKIFSSANVVLKNGAHIVIIIGDGKIDGKIYNSRENTLKIASKLNWKLVEEKYTELDRTSRSFRQSFRTKGKKEYFLVFKKQVEDVEKNK